MFPCWEKNYSVCLLIKEQLTRETTIPTQTACKYGEMLVAQLTKVLSDNFYMVTAVLASEVTPDLWNASPHKLLERESLTAL